jgi:hypothetical protein
MTTTYSYFRTIPIGGIVTITDEFEPGRLTNILAKQDTVNLDVGFLFEIDGNRITLDVVRFSANGFLIPLSIRLDTCARTPFRIIITNYSAFVRNVNICISSEGV